MSTDFFTSRNAPGLYTTKFVPFFSVKRKTMTIGIGAMCEAGRCIALGWDTRASYPSHHHLSPNDWTSKAYPLPHGCVAAVAGTLHECHEVTLQLACEIGKLGDEFELDDARDAINRARYHERDQIAEDKMLSTFGFSLSQWQGLKLDASVYDGGKKIFDRIPVKAEIILAGFKSKNPAAVAEGFTSAILYRAIRKNPIESENNYTVIGSGIAQAMRVLDKRGQNIHRSWQRTAIDVIAALYAAKAGNRRTVGNPDDLVLIFQDHYKRFPVQATYVKTLLERTKKAKISHLYDFDKSDNGVLNELLYDGPIVTV